MNERLFHACANVLILAVQLRTSARENSSASVREKAIAALDYMMAAGQKMAIAPNTLAEARYALVAFIDEQVLKSEWNGRAEWMSRPLQLEFYRETTAGENFFVRLRAHLQSGKNGPILEAYYLCLLLGFAGAYGSSGDTRSLQKFIEVTRAQVERPLPSCKRLSPHASRRGGLQAIGVEWARLAAVVGGSLLLGFGLLVGLASLTSSQLDELESRMTPSTSGVPQHLNTP